MICERISDISHAASCMRLNKTKGNWPLPECQLSVYENDRTVDHVVTGHLWNSRYRVGQWTMWLRATSGIPATAVDHR